jgi:RNA polymerase sigma-70 factor (ECF subfamily)
VGDTQQPGSLLNRSRTTQFPLPSWQNCTPGAPINGASSPTAAARHVTQDAPAPLESCSDAFLLGRGQAGDIDATNELLRRHQRSFRLHALRVSADPCEAEDVCQAGCLAALRHLHDLKDPLAFRPWVMRFITFAVLDSKRNSKKSGTPAPPNDTYTIETMIAEPLTDAYEDQATLLRILSEQARSMAAASRQVAALLLHDYRRDEEFPSVRAVARRTHTTQGTAERRYRSVFLLWRSRLAALGLAPHNHPNSAPIAPLHL